MGRYVIRSTSSVAQREILIYRDLSPQFSDLKKMRKKDLQCLTVIVNGPNFLALGDTHPAASEPDIGRDQFDISPHT